MEIFPEDKIDPTVEHKEFHVEQTLGVMGHVRAIAKKRKWQYLNESEMPEGASISFIRKFYSQPETAAVTQKDGVWAVWSGEGEPTDDAFPEYTPIDEGPGSEFLKGLQARLGIKPGESKEGAVVALPPPAPDSVSVQLRAVEAETTARNAAFKRAKDDEAYESASKAGQEVWAYSSIKIDDHVAMRRRYGTTNDAVIMMHPSGGIAAIWLGKGAPTRPAFPDVQQAPPGLKVPDTGAPTTHSFPAEDEGPFPAKAQPPTGVIGAILKDAQERKNGTSNTGHVPPTFPAPVGGSPLDEFHAAPMPPVPPPFIDDITPSKTRPPTDDLPKPVKVSGHVPSAALNEMGVKLYGMSKEPLYSEKLRQYLANVSDSLHAEAARIELSKMREKLDARDRPAADQTVVRIPPPGEK